MSRAELGAAHWARVFGEAPDEIVTAFDDIAPGFGAHIRDFAFGDVMGQGSLSPKERQIATVAALAALGDTRAQLKTHIKGALHAGCSRGEIGEILSQMAIYAGFPRAINGMLAAREAFAELDDAGA